MIENLSGNHDQIFIDVDIGSVKKLSMFLFRIRQNYFDGMLE